MSSELWSSDGAVILFSSDAGIHALHRRNPAKTEVIIPASEGKRALFPEFSPDNHWIVYTLGAPVIDPEAADLYVSPYPGLGDSRRITTGGGTFPIWNRKPSEILYTAPTPRETRSQVLSLFLALPITTEPFLTRRNPDELFRWLLGALGAGGGIGTERPYDVSHDGQHLVVARRDTAEPAASVGERPASAGETVETLRIHVVRNWIEEMKPRVPAP